LVRFEQHADEIRLVITDRAMTGMMGSEALHQRRSRRGNSQRNAATRGQW
jgi:hypothetical protein